MKIIIKIIEKDSFNIIDYNLPLPDYRDMINIFIELIISYISYDNKDINNNKHINNIISKIFLPLFQKENEQQIEQKTREDLLNFIYENLFSSENIKLIFLNPIDEIVDNIYVIFLGLININSKENNTKLHESLNKIINENNNISTNLYKIIFELIKKNNDDDDREIDNISTESFMTIYYKLYKENIENLK